MTDSRVSTVNAYALVKSIPDSRVSTGNVYVLVRSIPNSRVSTGMAYALVKPLPVGNYIRTAGSSRPPLMKWPDGEWLPIESFASASAYSNAVLADTPLAYWRLGGSSGTAMADSSGNNHTLTLTASTGVGATGILSNDTDKCWDAPGTQHGSVTNGTWMNTSSFTIECWCRPDKVSGYNALVTRDGDSTSRGWNMYIRDGFLLCYYYPPVEFTSSIPMSAGNTYHCVMTSDGTNVKLYVNGVLGASVATALTAPSGNAMSLAGSPAGTTGMSFQFDGRIDEVAYYGQALSEARITAHYQAGIA